MNQEYTHIATLTVWHQYFKDHLFNAIDFSFDEDSVRLMKDFGIIIKPFSGGFHLLSSNPDVGISDIDSSIKIYFTAKDPYYINYTDLATYSPQEDILFFSNRTEHVATDEDPLILHNAEFVGQHDIVPYRPDEQIRMKYTGFIELFIDTLFDDFNVRGKVNYGINFKTRYTIWKYFLVSPVYQNFDALSIVDTDNQPAFSGPQKQQLHDDVVARVFESNNELPLLEFNEDTYRLVNNHNSEIPPETIIIKNLPRASPEQLFMDSPNTEILYSHIYI